MKTNEKEHPEQILLGGDLAREVWEKDIHPLLQQKELSVRKIGERLGVSHETVWRWRRDYVREK